MKLPYFAILLSSLLFCVQSSYAEINIKKCQTNPSDYIAFDVDDAQMSENLIDHIFHNQPEKRENTVIKIFANDNAKDRNYWLASFDFDDQTSQYLFYQVDKNEMTEIDQTQI